MEPIRGRPPLPGNRFHGPNATMNPLRVTVSGIRNRTHAIYVRSWLRHAVGDGVGPVTVVELNGVGADFEDRIAAELPDIRFVDRHPDRLGDHAFVSIGSPAIKTWARFRFSPSAWPLRTVVVDEGIGSYGSLATRRSALRREGTREPMVTVRAGAGMVGRRWLPDESWRLYRRLEGQWQVDDRVAAEFRRAHRPPTLDRVVFVTQPWVENRLVTAEGYVAHLAAVREQVLATGSGFAVRPHPTEDVTRYRCFEVIEPSMPAELDPEVLSSRFVLGETSTALLNLAAVHHLPAARVVGPLAGISEIALSAGQEALFGRFVPTSVTVDQLASLLGT